MKNIISLILEWIGGATIITTALILIRISWEKFIKPINCDHCYKVDGYNRISIDMILRGAF